MWTGGPWPVRSPRAPRPTGRCPTGWPERPRPGNRTRNSWSSGTGGAGGPPWSTTWSPATCRTPTRVRTPWTPAGRCSPGTAAGPRCPPGSGPRVSRDAADRHWLLAVHHPDRPPRHHVLDRRRGTDTPSRTTRPRPPPRALSTWPFGPPTGGVSMAISRSPDARPAPWCCACTVVPGVVTGGGTTPRRSGWPQTGSRCCGSTTGGPPGTGVPSGISGTVSGAGGCSRICTTPWMRWSRGGSRRRGALPRTAVPTGVTPLSSPSPTPACAVPSP